MNADAFLDKAESLRTVDHPQFARMLEQIHRDKPSLTFAERWHLRYLDAWETMFKGDYATSERELREVIDHSGSPTLAAKASALLLNNLATNRRYEEAFALANRLASDLPQVKDPLIRFTLLTNLSQMLDYAGQTDLAIQYAHLAEGAIPRGETSCRPFSMEAAALYNAKRLTSTMPEVHRAIEACVAAQEPVFANAMRLTLGSVYLDEDQPGKALRLLDQVAPGVEASQYYPHMLSIQVERARAYAKLGDDAKAEEAALAAVAMSRAGDISEWLMVAYEILYKIEKRRGHAGAALSYYEHYVAQDKGYLNDISARALAYQVVQQQVAARKLETEALSKQNSILRLQRALDTKAVETSRLYILLLLVTLGSILFWLFRLKRSQLRFKKLSRQDSLTGILNHQHFIDQAGRALQMLQKRVGHACLVVFDLDHFKHVNDTHGHAVGDEVLKRAVAICQQQLRPSDLFGRLGGEEFGVLLQECSRQQGMDIANRIRAAIAGMPIRADDCTVAVSASVGLASTDTSGYELQRLCKEADAALYRAKRAGRNCVMGDIEIDGVMAKA